MCQRALVYNVVYRLCTAIPGVQHCVYNVYKEIVCTTVYNDVYNLCTNQGF